MCAPFFNPHTRMSLGGGYFHSWCPSTSAKKLGRSVGNLRPTDRAPTELRANPSTPNPPKTRSRAKFSSRRLRRRLKNRLVVTHAGSALVQSTITDLPVRVPRVSKRRSKKMRYSKAPSVKNAHIGGPVTALRGGWRRPSPDRPTESVGILGRQTSVGR